MTDIQIDPYRRIAARMYASLRVLELEMRQDGHDDGVTYKMIHDDIVDYQTVYRVEKCSHCGDFKIQGICPKVFMLRFSLLETGSVYSSLFCEHGFLVDTCNVRGCKFNIP